MKEQQRAMLMILDGWGIGKGDMTDAISQAHTPFMDSLHNTMPNHTLKTYGSHVGLPDGQMGNSEVGHLNIGAGRVVYQMFAKINKTFEEGTFQNNQTMQKLVDGAKKGKGNIHLLGLVSDGGIHSHINHLLGLCEILKDEGLDSKTFIHGFLDGRDTDPNSGLRFIEEVLSSDKIGQCSLSSIIGRYYAMDRDKRWGRIERAYNLLVKGTGEESGDPVEAVRNNYDNGITDEFMEPIALLNSEGEIHARIKDGDTVLFFNFRTDRGRELTQVLSQDAPDGTDMNPLDLQFYTMTEYNKDFNGINVLCENEDLKMTLGEYLSVNNKTQIRSAETEKYPHVTFFFSGGRESHFDGEERVLIPSPKVATYDLQPEMSAELLRDALLERIETDPVDFICVNFANADMVGHTGDFSAMKIACSAVDSCVEELVLSATKKGYKILIIADHGNADNAINADGSPNTAHSVNPVPCILIGCGEQVMKEGVLADVAPTILKMMGMDKPSEMTGESLY
jgi:2,3-bisphosphoglycerate-independent phosphoglycerate mutase